MIGQSFQRTANAFIAQVWIGPHRPQLGAIFYLKFLQDSLHVHFHRAGSNPQFSCQARVSESAREQRQHLFFALAERAQTIVLQRFAPPRGDLFGRFGHHRRQQQRECLQRLHIVIARCWPVLAPGDAKHAVGGA